MSDIKSVGDLEIEVLPPRAIMLLSKFSQKLKKHNGTVLKLASPTILQELEHLYTKVDDPELDKIYDDIKTTLEEHLRH